MILPLYVMRKYDSIFEEGNYKCIRTERAWYVLDYKSSDIECYADRRLNLLKEVLPYRLYPINQTVNTLEELVTNRNKRIFYTDSGKVFKWKKKAFYPIKDYQVRASWQTNRGYYMLDVKDLGIVKLKDYAGEKYAKVVEIGKSKLLYGVSEHKDLPPKRVKL